MSFGPDGKMLVAGEVSDEAPSVKLWGVVSWNVTRTLETARAIETVSVIPGGALSTSGEGEGFTLLNVAARRTDAKTVR